MGVQQRWSEGVSGVSHKAVTDDTEDVALNFGDDKALSRSDTVKHPIAVFFHLIFRVLAILTYLLCGWFSDSFIANFVFIVLFLSMDFWTVKNISGRLLVGLRWWNHVDEDGKSQWVFESRKGAAKSLISGTESRIFWLSMVVCQLFWIVFFFATLFSLKFKWFMVVCVGIVLNGANFYGYIRCKLGSRQKISSLASNFLGQQVLRSMFTRNKEGETSATTGQG
ncbi:hypothetical protein CAPTEDRAFT_186713 [Capitella teleta]|uniref:Golgi apparatus membrane protein TVP23 homolog n=1 Tax=Capitella teleta TaxID=283909 RepID=R7UHX5_CAPTE|nr:hypothetical protein CAPTEDRAFT_186713 [Capitella teleta]|eukprot:ELU05815.1 hypothetical protein CAPTEDRAFT_186713 [Capitella teleta]